jgi:hypothetical protein
VIERPCCDNRPVKIQHDRSLTDDLRDQPHKDCCNSMPLDVTGRHDHIPITRLSGCGEEVPWQTVHNYIAKFRGMLRWKPRAGSELVSQG